MLTKINLNNNRVAFWDNSSLGVLYILINKLAFGQTRFPDAADPIEHISIENFLLQIFAKMETFF